MGDGGVYKLLALPRVGHVFGHAMMLTALLILLPMAGALQEPLRQGPTVDEVLAGVPLVDGHNDFPIYIRAFYRNHIYGSNFSDDQELLGQVDFPRLRAGRVGAQFWSVYTECPTAGREDGAAAALALAQTVQQIDLVHRLVDRFPTRLQLAASAAEVWTQWKDQQQQQQQQQQNSGSVSLSASGLESVSVSVSESESESVAVVSSLLGVEGLHQVAAAPASALRLFHRLGVRYVSLTHACHNAYADSSSPPVARHGGLSPAGAAIVREMNRIGLVVDLSHASAASARHAIHLSRAPVLFTHSAAAALCPVARNVPDDVLLALRANDGVVMVNFWPPLVACAADASLADVVDHILYIGRLIGFRHVGLGADFDGMGFDSGPQHLEHVGTYPALIDELLRRRLSLADVRGVVGANVLRVLAAVEDVARSMADVDPLEDDVEPMF